MEQFVIFFIFIVFFLIGLVFGADSLYYVIPSLFVIAIAIWAYLRKRDDKKKRDQLSFSNSMKFAAIASIVVFILIFIGSCVGSCANVRHHSSKQQRIEMGLPYY